MAKRDPNKPKRNPWASDYRPYGVNSGDYGNPEQWKAAYDQRVSAAEATATLGAAGDSSGPHAVLGLHIGCTVADVKRAYRKLVMDECREAFGTNPDPAAEKRFKQVNAAYSLLMDSLGE